MRVAGGHAHLVLGRLLFGRFLCPGCNMRLPTVGIRVGRWRIWSLRESHRGFKEYMK